MTDTERKALENELYNLKREYLLTDESPENVAKGQRIREIKAILGIKTEKVHKKRTWLDNDCRKYAKYLL